MKRIVFISMLLAIASCSKIHSEEPVANNERHEIVITKAQAEYVVANNDFAARLTGEVAKSGKSFVISPLSVYYALSMLCNGADGETQEELLHALGYGADEIGDVNEFCKYLFAELTAADKTTKLSLANAFIYNSAMMDAKDGYKTALTNYYDALVKGFDFAGENKVALSFVNDWAEENTQGMIPELLHDLSPEAMAMLINAVFFDGKWANVGFKKSDTRKEVFTTADGEEKRMDMMNTEAEMLYFSNESFARAQLPYGNGAFVMNIILPHMGKTVEEVLPACHFGPTFGLLKNVQLRMPRFTTEAYTDLIPVLKSLGIGKAFSSNGDFSLISDRPMIINKCFQKSRFEADEEGTKAAAVTLVNFMAGAPLSPAVDRGPVPFHVTRPFIYEIVETSTDAILFTGVFRGE